MRNYQALLREYLNFPPTLELES